MPLAVLVTLGEVVRELRLERGLSQEEMGDLHRNYVGAVERAELNPTITQFLRLAGALGVSGTELLRRVEERSAPSS